MDAMLYSKILMDEDVFNIKKMQYKYPDVNVSELIELFKLGVYENIPLSDFNGNGICYMKMKTKIQMKAVKLLLEQKESGLIYGKKALEEEITSTLAIEDINTARDSVRRILDGYAPEDVIEKQIYGLKKGFEYISDPINNITENNMHTLYQLAVGEYLDDDSKLLAGNLYRHDKVYLVSQKIEHIGLRYSKLPEYMSELAKFITHKSDMNDFIKAAAIHFYIGYLHPYFDGNGRIARLVHQWYLIQKGFSSTLFYPFSSYIKKSQNKYYRAFTMAENNAKLTGVMDVTPFLVYFDKHVYAKLYQSEQKSKTLETYRRELADGEITEKEKDLWNYVLSAYGEEEFSTKQLEKSFGNAAYATIRGFVLKFKFFGLLTEQKYGNRVKYKVKA